MLRRIANGREDCIQHDIACCPVVGMIQVNCPIRFFIGIRRKNVLAWVMRDYDTRTIFAYEPDNHLASGFAIGKMAVGKAQKFDSLNT